MYSDKELQQLCQKWVSDFCAEGTPRSLYEPIEYALSVGGKRLRPLLLLMAYHLYREDVEKVKPQALGIELYHNFTLLHDDVMDRADMRRGKPTVHKQWNDNAAILSGDAMTIMAYRQMAQCEEKHLPDVMALFSRTALEICEGQQFDMDFEKCMQVSEAEYMEMIRLKTSVLLAASLKIGALLADAPTQDAGLLYDFGIQLGLAFQLKDDLLDVYGNPDVFGKKTGGDILCNKKTFLLVKAMELANEQQRRELCGWMGRTSFVAQEKIDAVTALYNIIGVKVEAERKIEACMQRAAVLLAEIDAPKERKALLAELMDGLRVREV